jgi:hypothetical protein
MVGQSDRTLGRPPAGAGCAQRAVTLEKSGRTRLTGSEFTLPEEVGADSYALLITMLDNHYSDSYNLSRLRDWLKIEARERIT